VVHITLSAASVTVPLQKSDGISGSSLYLT